MRHTRLAALYLCLTLSAFSASAADIHHKLTVTIDPGAHTFRAVDALTLTGEPAADPAFLLHSEFQPQVLSPGWRLERLSESATASFAGINSTSATAGQVPLEGYRLVREDQTAGWPVDLSWGGAVNHPLQVSGEEYQRSFSETPGLIDERGVFLSGTTYWVPTFGDALLTFDLTVEGLTPPWDVVSQGGRTLHRDAAGRRTVTWSCSSPQEEVYLVAGPWHEYSSRAGKVELFAFLRSDDAALAQRYLEATRRYLTMYQAILPPYPYPSFSLVENFWETGYGMPGFTLLGPRIIRFPWIITSSYPHELLHNWWGNSVYVDFDRGNWCEGLTAYMADHMLAEQRGDAGVYRRATLKKFTDFVGSNTDFPLTQFGSRSSAASEAVGYGKALMIFHMIRRAVGDQAFLASLRRFADRHRFQRASWDDIAEALEATTGGSWKPFLDQWITRTGAPGLEIVEATAHRHQGTAHPWSVHLRLRQVGVDRPFPLSVPVAITVEGQREALTAEVGSCESTCELEVPCPSRPLRLDVDPAFDVMRRLDPLEVPPALSTLFGDDNPLFVLPSEAGKEELEAWRGLAAAWARPSEPDVVLDSDLSELPDSRACWILGWDNRFGPELAKRIEPQGVVLGADTVALRDRKIPRSGHSVVLVARAAGDPAVAQGWVTASPAEAIAGLGRKLPHYTRYSYLAFKGEAPDNISKGMWQPLASPLVVKLSDEALPPLELPNRDALTPLPPAFDAASMMATVRFLASPELEGRGLGSPGLDEATRWVEGRLSEAKLAPAGPDGYRQEFEWDTGAEKGKLPLTNLIGRVPGTDASLPPVLVTAHLDHLGHGWPDVRSGNEGKIHPGADDNASGVAVLIELAKALAAAPANPRTVLFAVTTGEEAGLIGARHLISSMTPEQRPYACINLDTVGRLKEGKLYVLDTASAREWRYIWMGVGATTGAPVTMVSEPLDASDQGACLEAGIPAVQLFTGPTPDYHRPSDTPDKIDAEGMATVTEAAHEALVYLAGRREPLTVTLKGHVGHPRPHPGPSSSSGRRVSLGTMPDFSYSGEGVRVAQVLGGSAAEQAGIRPGDILVAFDGSPLADLRDFATALGAHEPGDTVTVTVRRSGKKLDLKATLTRR